MLKKMQYDLTIRKLFETIIRMSTDERRLLLVEAERLKTGLRATRRNCCVATEMSYADRVHPVTITNLSFTGAFVECYIPVRIGDAVSVKFKNADGSEETKLNARIVHATRTGIGIRFNGIRSREARFLQKCLDDFRSAAPQKK